MAAFYETASLVATFTNADDAKDTYTFRITNLIEVPDMPKLYRIVAALQKFLTPKGKMQVTKVVQQVQESVTYDTQPATEQSDPDGTTNL